MMEMDLEQVIQPKIVDSTETKVCPWCYGSGWFPEPGNMCPSCGGLGTVKK